MILGDYSVDQAYIHLGSDRTIPLLLVDEDSNLWKCSEILPGDPIKDRFKYKYGFDFTRKNLPYCEEPIEKQVELHTQFDVFHFPEEKDYMSETVPESIVFYLKWLLQYVESSTISEILAQIESIYFINLCPKHVKECVNWIVEDVLGFAVSDIQRLYLCIVLSNLGRFLSPQLLPNDKKTADACDRLLQCLNACVYSSFLSESNFQRLGKIASFLVKNSSSPGWLTLAAHFYPYLGAEHVLDEENTKGLNYRYDVKEYKKMVDTLLSHIKKKNGNDKVAHQDLLDLVLKHVPNLDAVRELFESTDIYCLFNNEEEKVDFFVKFYQGKVRATSTQKESAGAKLVEFYKIPEKIRCRMHKFLSSTLLEYAKADNEELNDDHVEIFLESIISENDLLYTFHVLEILTELSKSKSASRQTLLLEILNDQLFGEYWRETPHLRKVDICKLWVITRVVNKSRASSLTEKSLSITEKIVTAYVAIDAIMQCSLNISDKALAQDVSTCVEERILRSADAISILQAFARIEKCAPVVQDCYKSHVRRVLEKAPKMIKKLSMVLKECSNSRYCIILISFTPVFEISYKLISQYIIIRVACTHPYTFLGCRKCALYTSYFTHLGGGVVVVEI